MNPRDRKLRLRKSTLRDLSPAQSPQVRGGRDLQTASAGVILCSDYFDCGPQTTDPQTAQFTNCVKCQPSVHGTCAACPTLIACPSYDGAGCTQFFTNCQEYGCTGAECSNIMEC